MLKNGYKIFVKEDYEESHEIVFLNRNKAETYFRKMIEEAFELEETETDDMGGTVDDCVEAWYMRCGPFVAEITIVDVELD